MERRIKEMVSHIFRMLDTIENERNQRTIQKIRGLLNEILSLLEKT